MQGPVGYPPPTLVRKRSGSRRLRAAFILFGLIVLAAGGYAVTRLLLARAATTTPQSNPSPVVSADSPVLSADAPAEALPDTAAVAPVTVETPANVAVVETPVDARRPNNWYYVRRLGDGPGVIYSKTGGEWSYALACTAKTKMIEIIAVGTGSPGGFDRQAITVGKVRLMMDATYSPDGGGTISTTLPAGDAFFSALDGSAPMEIQLLAARKTVVPVGPDVVRLVRDCRGRN
ncbi:MAG: hypothetical protein V4618_05555 [Pseudomonadota bacterium]